MGPMREPSELALTGKVAVRVGTLDVLEFAAGQEGSIERDDTLITPA